MYNQKTEISHFSGVAHKVYLDRTFHVCSTADSHLRAIQVENYHFGEEKIKLIKCLESHGKL